MSNLIPFDRLSVTNLIQDNIYKGGQINNLSSEPISKILPVGNQSGIRFSGSVQEPQLVVLYSTFNDNDWPDHIGNNILTYYGDNKEPGREIHETIGNKLFRIIFNNLHLNKKEAIPPIFLFSKGGSGFDRIFKGLLIPGNNMFQETEDLIAIWKTKKSQRFQNYKAIFSILSIKEITRDWINDIINNNRFSSNAPVEWINWINKK